MYCIQMNFILPDKLSDLKTTALPGGFWCCGDFVIKRNTKLDSTYI